MVHISQTAIVCLAHAVPDEERKMHLSRNIFRAHKAPTPEPVEDPLPDRDPVPVEDPKPHPDPEVRRRAMPDWAATLPSRPPSHRLLIRFSK